MKKLISVMLALAVALSCFTMLTGLVAVAAGGEADYTTEVWSPVEVTFDSVKTYANPYTDVDIDVTFVCGETSITLPGFWYGENTWAFRFSPTKTGVWTYTVSCTDKENTALDGLTGTIEATAATGTSMTAQHGFLRVSDDSRYLSYADGTDFFWLGDTNWQAPSTLNNSSCNYPGCDCGSQFKHIVNDRVAKGFTVFQTYFCATSASAVQGNTSYWAATLGGEAVAAGQYVNIDVWNTRLDDEFAYLASVDMVAAVGFGCHSGTIETFATQYLGKKLADATPEELDAAYDYAETITKRLARYFVARYACNNIAYISGQEITMNNRCFDVYEAVSAYLGQIDGYKHLNTAHQTVISSDNARAITLGNATWHDFYLLQGGHSMKTKSTYSVYYYNTNVSTVKPIIEGELQYEEINCGPFTGYDNPRYGAWKAMLSGTAGFTYGASGVWAASYSTSVYTGWLGGDSTYSYEPWYMGVDKQGSFEVSYMKEFFQNLPSWQSLIPQYYDTTYADFNEVENKMLAATADMTTAVAYFYNDNLVTGTIKGLNDSASYNAYWFNPRTGKYMTVDTGIFCENGIYAIPNKPTTEDWVFVITTAEFTDVTFENQYVIDNSTVTLTGDRLTPVSFKANGGVFYTGTAQTCYNNTSYLIDNKVSTVWEPYADRATQFFNFDFGTAKELSNIAITVKAGTIIPDYRVYASNDGEDWTIILDTAVNGKQNKTGITYMENLYGGWRYVRVMLLNPETLSGKQTKEYETHYNKYMNCTYSHTAIAEMAIYGTGNATTLGYKLPADYSYQAVEEVGEVKAVSLTPGSYASCSYHGDGYITPFKGITFTGDTYTAQFYIYNDTDQTISAIGLSNYWGYICYLSEDDAVNDRKAANTYKTINLAPGEYTTVSISVPRSAIYSNASGAVRDTAHAGADSNGKFCSYDKVGLRIDVKDKKVVTEGSLFIMALGDDADIINKNLVQMDWHDNTKTTVLSDFSGDIAWDVLVQFEEVLGHTPCIVTPAKAATCTTAGCTAGIECAVCSTVLQTSIVIPPISHNYIVASSEATCTTKGETTYSCINCGDTYSTTEEDYGPHAYVDKVVEPTEACKGYTLHKCSVCGECMIDTYVDATGASSFVASSCKVTGTYTMTKLGFSPITGEQTSNVSVFRNLNFGEGDFCSVTLVVYNNTNQNLKEFKLANNWGCYIFDTTGTKYVASANGSGMIKAGPIEAGEVLSFTFLVPRDAYYSNKTNATGTPNTTDDGGGYLCNYTDTAFRIDFAGAPTGNLVMFSTNHPEINADLYQAFPAGGGSLITSKDDLPDAAKPYADTYVSRTDSSNAFFADMEGASDQSLFKTFSATISRSNEQALSGNYSLKLVGGTANYASAAVLGTSLAGVIDGDGLYIMKGYIYVDTLPASKYMSLNLRQKNNSYYNSYTSGGVSLDESNVGKWKEFQMYIQLPGGKLVTDPNGIEVEDGKGGTYMVPYWFDSIDSVAFDGIGNGCVVYFDDISFEKTEEFGTVLTFDQNASYYQRVSAGLSELPDGEYTYSWRVYNLNDYAAKFNINLQGGDRNGDGKIIGWDYLACNTNENAVKIDAHCYIDVTKTFTVQDNQVEVINYSTHTTGWHPLSTVYLRVDVEQGTELVTKIVDDEEVQVEQGNNKSGAPNGTKFAVVELTADTPKINKLKSATGFTIQKFFTQDAEEYDVAVALESGHTWMIREVAATCDTDGYTLYTCTDDGCGKIITGNIVPAYGHTEGAAATCTTDCICLECGKVAHPKLGHSLTLYYEEAATTTAIGYKLHKCSVCYGYVAEAVEAENTAYGVAVQMRSKQYMTKFYTQGGTVVKTPFANLEFAEGETSKEVTLTVYNGLNVTLDKIQLSNYWGTVCYLTAEDAAAKKTFGGTGSQVSLAPGASATVTLKVPRSAYYTNTAGQTGDVNSGNGVLCDYKGVGLRIDTPYSADTPSTGSVFISFADKSLNQSFAECAMISSAGSKALVTNLNDVPEAVRASVLSRTGLQKDGSFVLDAEDAGSMSYIYKLGAGVTELSTEQVFSGKYSYKFSGGKYAYDNFALNTKAINAVIKEAGTYALSGWIYVEKMPSDGTTQFRLNCRQAYENRYCQSGTRATVKVGTWVPFSIYINMPGGQYDTDPTSEHYWLNDLNSLALEDFGKESVYYVDDLRLEKVDNALVGAKFVWSQEPGSSSQNHYSRNKFDITNMADGTYTYTYRYYNTNDYNVYVSAYLQNGWSGIANAGENRSIVYAHSYHEYTRSFTITTEGADRYINGTKITAQDDVHMRVDLALSYATTMTGAIGDGVFVVDVAHTDGMISLTDMINAKTQGTVVASVMANSADLMQKKFASVKDTYTAQHTFVDTVVDVTDTTAGYTHHVCSDCGYTYDDNYVYPTATVVLGDVNGDGNVNAVDRAVLARYLAAWNGYTIVEANADINGDKVVDENDLDILTKYFAGWKDYQDLTAFAPVED